MVVVSDHHMPPEELPPAHAITNPRLSEDNPCPHLAGVGVAFFLMAALNGKLEAMSGKRIDVYKRQPALPGPRAAMKRTARTTISFRSKNSSAAGKPDFLRNGPTCTAIITGRRWPPCSKP